MEHQYKFKFVVEKGYKTSYINSLFMALFYKRNNNIETLLNNFPENPAALYLQELIKDNFIEPIRKQFSIKSNNINEIRNYIIINSMEYSNLLIKQEDIGNFYKFIVDFFNGEYVQFEIFKITDNIINSTNSSLKMPFISLNPTSLHLFVKFFSEYKNLCPTSCDCNPFKNFIPLEIFSPKKA